MSKRPKDSARINWNGYQGTRAVFPVCMRSPSVRGSSLIAQLDQASLKINQITIVMCDSLDRHNVQDLDNATAHCIDLAESWLQNNYSAFKARFSKVEVLRWETDIRGHHSFDNRLRDVQQLGSSSVAVKQLRDSMASYYLNSKLRRFEADYQRGLSETFDTEQALQSSRAYLEEEFAGNMVYGEMTGWIPNIYWGLYVDDHQIFERESGDPRLAFPDTLPVSTDRYGDSIQASSLRKNRVHQKKLVA